MRQLGTGQSLVDAIAQQGKLCQPKIAIRLAQFIFYRTRQLDCFRVGISSFIQAQLIEIQAPQAEQRIDNSEVIPAGAVGFQYRLIICDGFVKVSRQAPHIRQTAARIGFVNAVLRANKIVNSFLILLGGCFQAATLQLDMS